MDIKEKIKHTARELFYNNGFKNVRTDDVAKSIGISKKTLYSHFNSKEELFEVIFEEDLATELIKIKTIVDNISNKENLDFISELEYLYNVSSKSKCNYSKDFFRDLKIYFPILWNKLIILR